MIDADYHAEPDFLARCTPLFEDPGLGILQTPQDYREWDFSGCFRRLHYSYKYFFDVSQIFRNERATPIFGGTMGLIRRNALVTSGGWDEWCITEDAELSLRLLRDGWAGTHVDQAFGRGIMPLTFEAVKRQRFPRDRSDAPAGRSGGGWSHLRSCGPRARCPGAHRPRGAGS